MRMEKESFLFFFSFIFLFVHFFFVFIRDALNHVLYEDICARENVPPFRASIKDGYAFYKVDEWGGKIKVVGSTVAGSKVWKIPLERNECLRVSTGSPIPPNTCYVVQVEDTEIVEKFGPEEKYIKVLREPQLGQDIREIGSDIKEGDVLFKEGELIHSPHLGVLAAGGIANIKVLRKPVIGVLSTGNELQPLTSGNGEIEEGRIYDSNKIALMSLLLENGYSSLDMGIARDNPDDMLCKLGNAFEKCDIVVTSGCVSMGEYDILDRVLEADFGAEIHIGRILMKPGKPMKFATLYIRGIKKYIFALPGNPVSAMVCCTLFVIPALKAMCKSKGGIPSKRFHAKIPEDIKLDSRPEFLRAQAKFLKEGEKILLDINFIEGSQRSSTLLNMCRANCLLHLPGSSAQNPTLRAGSIVNVTLIREVELF